MRIAKCPCASAMLVALATALACTGDADTSTASGGDKAPDGPPGWILASVEQPRGLIRNEPGASAGYVLFTQFTSDLVYLMDREGLVVHTWRNEKAGDPNYLTDDGHLFRLARIAEPPSFRSGGVAGYIQKLDWDGNVVWEWKMGDEQRILHHDIEPLPNGNLLAIGWELIPAAEAIAAGRRPDLVPEQGLWADWVLEIEPLPPGDARIVWEWHVWDHLVQNRDPNAPHYGDPAAHPRRLDVNADADAPEIDAEELEQLKALGYVPDNADEEDVQSDFLHMNAVDYHPGLDQIAVSLPEIGEIWIIDHSTTTGEARGSTGGRSGRGGDLLYRWGNPKNYGRGDKSDQRLFYQHQVLWVEDDREGAGHLTIFNNGGGRPGGDWSSVVEIIPPLEADGNYRLPELGRWGPAEPHWTYVASERSKFFSPFVSGAHRLANGNTFVCAGPQGHYFEVTPTGQVVWEYRNPYHGSVEGWQPPGTEQVPYASFRATKIPPDHEGLAGRTLVPLDPQPPVYELPPGPPPGAAPAGDPAAAASSAGK